jgi:hypothetical protein
MCPAGKKGVRVGDGTTQHNVYADIYVEAAYLFPSESGTGLPTAGHAPGALPVGQAGRAGLGGPGSRASGMAAALPLYAEVAGIVPAGVPTWPRRSLNLPIADPAGYGHIGS